MKNEQKGFVIPKFPKNLFSGRIGNLNYSLGWLLLTSLFCLLMYMLYLSTFLPAEPGSIFSMDPLVMILGIPFLLVLCILYLFFWLILSIRRCHDIGISGWYYLPVYILLVFTPLGFILQLYFFFKKGEEKSNKYGNPPSENRKFLADIFNY